MEVRFWSNVQKSVDPGGCWWWLAQVNAQGYGVMHDAGVMALAHRISWRLHFGAAPAGLCVCHRCDNPRCVNPDHLFVGTQGDNMRDAANKGRLRMPTTKADQTHCKRGHELAKENLYTGRVSRQCIECHRIRARANRALQSTRP